MPEDWDEVEEPATEKAKEAIMAEKMKVKEAILAEKVEQEKEALAHLSDIEEVPFTNSQIVQIIDRRFDTGGEIVKHWQSYLHLWYNDVYGEAERLINSILMDNQEMVGLPLEISLTLSVVDEGVDESIEP